MENRRFELLIHIGAVLRTFPSHTLHEALSVGQIESKKWLIERLEALNLDLGTVFVLGGWVGLLPAMFYESKLRFDKLRSFDIDPSCAELADTMNRKQVMNGWGFKASFGDMYEIDYSIHRYKTKRADGTEVELEDSPDTIINTVCEHINRFPDWWERVPKGKLLVLQSNNLYSSKDHCNCVSSLDQFSKSAPMSKILFKGELETAGYKRFMLIGNK